MPTFAYAGRTRGGETVTGERVADTMDAVVAALRREQVESCEEVHLATFEAGGKISVVRKKD